MDYKSSTKKSKRMEAQGDGSFSVTSAGISGDVGILEKIDGGAWDENYFTPELMDVWPNILEYVTDPKDVLSVINASPAFRRMLKRRKASALLPLVLPILMKQNNLEPREVFKCRLLSKPVKESVDDVFVQQRYNNQWIRRNSYKLYTTEVIQQFMDGTRGLSGNPFLSRNLEIVIFQRTVANVMNILQRYGQELCHISIKICVNSSPEAAMRVLQQICNYLPHVELMKVEIPQILKEDKAAWCVFATAPHQLPAMPRLRALRVGRVIYGGDHFVPPPTSFVKPIWIAYGSQLSLLSLNSFVFRGNTFRSICLKNLRSFQVFFRTLESSERLAKVLRNLAMMECPQVNLLTLGGKGMRLTAETFLALNKFKGSTIKLRLDNLEGDLQLIQLDPAVIQEFPQLTELILCTADVGSEWMHLFRVMFSRLEVLRFQPPKKGFRVTAEPPVPDMNERRNFFFIFPMLKELVWNSEGPEQISFGRQEHY